MEFIDPDTTRSAEQSTKGFCSMLMRLLTYMSKTVSSRDCVLALDEIRSKYRTALGTVYTYEDMTERVGVFLMKFETAIQAYDDNFLRSFDFAGIFGEKSEQYVALRSSFFGGTTLETRTVMFDALNNLLLLYARYCVYARRA